MVAHARKPYISPQEYLQREREAATKSEYYDGIIVAMAGASPNHNAVAFNLAFELGGMLRGGDCRGFRSDMRVRVPDCNRYYYPDLAVVCGEPEFEQIAGVESLLNPTVLIEVLSDTTERTDRTDKLDCYRTLASLQTYILVAQDTPRIESYSRQADGSWRYDSASGLDAVLPLPALNGGLRFAEVYARVEFPIVPMAEAAE